MAADPLGVGVQLGAQLGGIIGGIAGFPVAVFLTGMSTDSSPKYPELVGSIVGVIAISIPIILGSVWGAIAGSFIGMVMPVHEISFLVKSTVVLSELISNILSEIFFWGVVALSICCIGRTIEYVGPHIRSNWNALMSPIEIGSRREAENL